MDELSKQLEADLMGNSSKSPRENWAVAEILRLRALLDEKHAKGEKGSTLKGKSEQGD